METKSPKGTRDLLPAEMIVRQKIIKIIRSVFEAYGFSPLETPAFEYAALLEGKYGEQEKLIYKFRDRAGRALALRYDLTIPLIRVVGARPNLPKPIKRYCIGRVWRYDRPQRGRYREFWQCDVDIVGVPSALADAEVLTCVAAALKRLGLNRFRVRVNSRTVLESVAQWAGVPKRLNIELFRTLDKLDKIGIQGIKKELTSKGVDSSAINKSIKIIQIKGSPKVVSAKLERVIGKTEGLAQLKELINYLSGARVCTVFDLSLARGLDYYTGMIFEIEAGEGIGSIAAGGRYDKIIGQLTGKELPATGISIGLDRLIEIIKLKRLVPAQSCVTKVFVVPIKTLKKSLKIVQKLREAGINTDIDLLDRSISKNLDYANRQGIPYVLFIGKKELARKNVKLRDMRTGKERFLTIAQAIKELS